MRAGNFILNETFLKHSSKGLKNINELIILYEWKTVIFESAKFHKGHPDAMKILHEDLHIIEEAIQEAFGFFPNRDYHRFWEWPFCECPKLDNIDNWGTKYHYYSQSCPIHYRFIITQKNWKDKFFEAVEESVEYAKKPTPKEGQIWYWDFIGGLILLKKSYIFYGMKLWEAEANSVHTIGEDFILTLEYIGELE